MPRILIADAESVESRQLESALRQLTSEVERTGLASVALERLKTSNWDALIVGARAAGPLAWQELVAQVKSSPRLRSLPVVFAASAGDGLTDAALRAGCDHVLDEAQRAVAGSALKAVLRRKRIETDMLEDNRRLEAQARTLRQGRELGKQPCAQPVPTVPDAAFVLDVEGVVLDVDSGAHLLVGRHAIGRRLTRVLGCASLPREAGRSLFPLKASGERSFNALLIDCAEQAGAPGTQLLLLFDPRLERRELCSQFAPLTAPLAQVAPRVLSDRALTGPSASVQALRQNVAAAAASPGNVWLWGPEGSGRKYTARIVANGQRVARPLLHFRCAELAPASAERELFGTTSESGAQQLGLLAAANGGTILLENADQLSLELQERLASCVGRGRSEQFDLRILATSSRPLDWLVREGLFSVPFARLFGFSLEIPGLSRRSEDIPALLCRFLADAKVQQEQPISNAAVAALASTDWNDSVRALRYALEDALRLAAPGTVQVVHLSGRVQAHWAELSHSRPAVKPAHQNEIHAENRAAAAQPWDITEDDPISLELYEKKALLRALDRCGGDKVATAQLLDLGKSTLYRKLKRFGIK